MKGEYGGKIICEIKILKSKMDSIRTVDKKKVKKKSEIKKVKIFKKHLKHLKMMKTINLLTH